MQTVRQMVAAEIVRVYLKGTEQRLVSSEFEALTARQMAGYDVKIGPYDVTFSSGEPGSYTVSQEGAPLFQSRAPQETLERFPRSQGLVTVCLAARDILSFEVDEGLLPPYEEPPL